MVRWNDEVSSCLRARSVIVLRPTVAQGVSFAWLYNVEPRTEPSGLAPDDPDVKHRDISISVGDATCQQKADGKMKGIQKERLSDSLTFIRVTEGGRTPMRGVLLWGFLSNFNLHSTFNSFSLFLSLPSCLSVFVFLPTYVCLDLPVCLFLCLSACLVVSLQPCPLTICFRNLQPCHQLHSPLMMWTSTLRHRPTTRSTVASRGPRSSWRSGTATAWRGWVSRSSQDTTSLIKYLFFSCLYLSVVLTNTR